MLVSRGVKSDSSTTELISLLDRYEAFVRQAGKQVRRSSPEDARLIFSRLEPDHLQQIIQKLKLHVSIFEQIIAAGEKLSDSPKLLWRYLAAAGLRPCSDIFGRIDDTDVVELYGTSQTHLWENFNFFDWVSMTLERLFCETWYESTGREKEIELQLQKTVIRIFSGKETGTFDPEIPWHLVEELDSEMLFKFLIRVKWVSPVYRGSQVAGFITVNECRDRVSGK